MSSINDSITKLNLSSTLTEKLKSLNLNIINDIWILKRKELKEKGLTDNEIKSIIIALQLTGLDLNKKIYDYDQIYVTDLCIKEPLLKQINEDEELRNKLKVLDHHKTEIEEGNNKYNFITSYLFRQSQPAFFL